MVARVWRMWSSSPGAVLGTGSCSSSPEGQLSAFLLPSCFPAKGTWVDHQEQQKWPLNHPQDEGKWEVSWKAWGSGTGEKSDKRQWHPIPPERPGPQRLPHPKNLASPG